ncbi:MAG: hypothetical protein ACPGSW_00800, partial [Phaeobacter italicus]
MTQHPDLPSAHKARLAPLFSAMRDFAEAPVRAALAESFAPDATIHLCHPFGDLTGPIDGCRETKTAIPRRYSSSAALWPCGFPHYSCGFQ